jgi:predicted PurR-regulated permease PerM
MTSPNSYQNAFQNAGQNGSFYYNEVGNQSSTFIVLLLAVILLISLLKSEGRYRELMRQFDQYKHGNPEG